MELLGLACDLAKNGRGAVDSVRQTRYDIILMDVAMPVMNGFDATAAIRSYQNNQHQKPSLIIAMTGESDLTECLTSGMDDFMQKPGAYLATESKVDLIYGTLGEDDREVSLALMKFQGLNWHPLIDNFFY